jgi:hypothetical protein
LSVSADIDSLHAGARRSDLFDLTRQSVTQIHKVAGSRRC